MRQIIVCVLCALTLGACAEPNEQAGNLSGQTCLPGNLGYPACQLSQ